MEKRQKVKIVYTPAKPTSPDVHNKNRIVTTSIEINNIKRYLESVKNNHIIPKTPSKQEDLERENLFSSSRKSHSYQIEEMLRTRIKELELQNNEFRMMEKQYEALVVRNHDLQQKMIMLLSQLELSYSERGSPINNLPMSNTQIKQIQEYSTIENVYTEQSSKESVQNELRPKAFKNETSSVKGEQTEVFENVTLDKKGQSQRFLLRQNKEVIEYIEQQIKASMATFQAKFIGYVKTIEQQMRQMQLANEQILKLKLASSSNSENQIRIKVKSGSSRNSDQHHLPQFYVKNQRPLFNTPEDRYHQNELHDNSLVNIEMDNVSDSQHSFGKSHRPNHSKLSVSKPFYTPESYPKIDSASSQLRNKSDYSQRLMKKVFESLDSIRQNLTFLLGEQNIVNDGKIHQFETRMFEQLQHIILSFFPGKNKKFSLLQQQEHLGESLLLRSKTIFANKEEKTVTHEVMNDKHVRQSENNKQSSKGDLSYNYVVPRLCSQQFQATQRKLVEIIEIMKAFNQEYRQILQRNHIYRGKPWLHSS